MSTAVIESSAPATDSAPGSLLTQLYSSPTPAVATSDATTSTPTPETGSAATPQESAVPAGTVKADPQKDAEAEQAKAAEVKKAEEKAKAEESHRAAARKLGTEVKELKTQLMQVLEDNRILKARLDGTYEEPQQPTPEQIAERAKFEGRELASRELAYEKYGQDKVEERIYAEQSEYKGLISQEPWYHVRVANSPHPTLEAWTVLEEHAFKTTYGNDPTQWAAKIIAEAKPAIVEEFKKTLTVTPTGHPAPSVTQARGDGGPTARPKTLAELMYGAPPRT